jgi:formate-dependent nitrite reductase membrane component NrfD
MQACPYDALYIDPERNTAAKCNFDASRVAMGYKPACEVVCPTQAILSGDLDDPNSELSRRIGTEKTSVRKPEKGTQPKLFYAGVEGDLLQPTRMTPQPTHLWAEKSPGEDLYALQNEVGNQKTSAAREVYDVPHATPWGWKIASYLWTKAIAAGVLLLSALALHVGFEQDAPVLYVISPIVAVVFLAVTFLLLVLDLKKPGRFLYILTKPNLNSWLVLGGYILVIYGILSAVWLFQGITGQAVTPLVVWPTTLFAIASACYSAFLFGQARGRDFWQSPLLFWQLLVQAFTAGAALLMFLGSLQLFTPFQFLSGQMFYWLGNILVVSLFAGLAMIFAELFVSHASEEALRSADLLIKRALRKQFWILVVALGMIAPIALILWPSPSLIPNMVASALALFGLWMYENLWIKAGQAVPLS